MATDETTQDQPTPETSPADEGTTAVADAQAPEEGKLHQTVEISDAGPCKKHIKVTVDRGDIDQRKSERFKELVTDANAVPLPGFRPGKAPRKIVERKFAKEVNDQVKSEVLMASLEQLATDHDISPLAPPDLDPSRIEIPDDGPLVYEFDVEVRPEFDLPDYKGLKLKRPVQTFSEADIDRAVRRVLEPDGQVVPKPGDAPAVEEGDIIITDITTRHNDAIISRLQEVRLRVDTRLVLTDGVVERFAAQMAGAKVGDERTLDLRISENAANPQLRGQVVKAGFFVKDVKTVRLPELTPEVLASFGVGTVEAFRELIRVTLERRLEYQQRQSARSQILQQIDAATKWDLPQDLLMRQARRTFARRVMEMRNAGMSEEQIKSRQKLLEQDVLANTAAALKEHFVLQKIAEVEKLEIGDDDIEAEIDAIADRTDESPRRVRARLEKEDMIEALATELLERKALDLVLANAEYEDVSVGDAPGTEHEGEATAVEAQAVPGEVEAPPADGQ